MTLPVKILFYLENDEIALVEIKRTDRSEETDKSKVFFWLLFRKPSGEIEKLDFVSMKSEKEEEERVFRQGKLSFNPTSGLYKTVKGKYILKNISGNNFPEKMEEKINTFLSGFPE
jgi:hypothetical protein